MTQAELVQWQETRSEQDLITGQISPPPRQLWYLTQRENWDGSLYWNVVQFVEVLHRLDPTLVRQVVGYLLKHNDALRIRTKQDISNYYYVFAPLDDEVPFSYEDLSSVPEQNLPSAIETIAQKYQVSLNLIDGPLLQVVLFDLGPQKTQRLLLIVSHTACDAVSLQILMNDFVVLYSQISQGFPVRLPSKTTSIKLWTEIKSAYSCTREFQEELKYWHSLPWNAICPLPIDYPENRNANTRESVRTITASLSPEETGILVRELPRATHSQIIDILLATLMQTLMQWTGSSIHALFLPNHGRITPFPGVNLSRTVGNLVAIPQIVLDTGGAYDIWEVLTNIKNQVRLIPYHGLMWEWLPVDMTLKSDLAFNYLGMIGSSNQRGTPWFRQAPESAGPQDNPQDEHWTLIVCNAFIKNKTFYIKWSFSKNLYDESTVRNLANEYISILRALLQKKQEQ